ncbi:ORF6N domain-containing protein [Candidatus Woesearchaeota archaeon]|nr:ORF6N domain-containing protein [Candidatus Woesearchaeota archaeon]
MDKKLAVFNQEDIRSKIHTIRSVQVMLDRDLAELYGVETFNLNKAVKRNIERFPSDFMFQLTKVEYDSLKFQFGISKIKGRGGRRSFPYAFTEQGVATLSGVLKSKKAIEINIQIISC